MKQKKIFIKKSKFTFINFFLIFISFFIIYFFFIINYNKNLFLIIPPFEDKYYIIPNEKGGKKIDNINKKSLHMNEIYTQNQVLNNIENLSFSIQFFSSSNYNETIDFVDGITNSNETKYYKNDFIIVSFQSQIGIDYLLLYKNFDTRDDAYNFCLKYISDLEKCLIVDVQALIK